MRVLIRLVVLAGLVVLLTAGPAAADPAKPGDYTSTITDVTPPLDGVQVKVIGGDSFLQVSADPGREVIVYAQGTPDEAHGEPFLRIRADGVVEQNMQSPYTYSIQDRYGNVKPPDGLDPTGPPEWQQVGTGGVFAWHDHRIHWMSPTKKPGIKPGDVVQTWTVPMSVDGVETTISGVLVLAAPISAIPWFLLAAVVAIVAVVVGKGTSTLVAGIVVLVASAFALYVGYEYHQAVPARAGGSALQVVLPAISVVAGIVAVALHRKPAGVIGSLLAAACLGAWSIQRIAVLFNPVLPTGISYNVDRAATAFALGAAVGAAVLAVRSGGLIPHFAELSDEEDTDPRPAVAGG